jgi:hypothetical protein
VFFCEGGKNPKNANRVRIRCQGFPEFFEKVVLWPSLHHLSILVHINLSKEPCPQDGALKPKFSKPKIEIPKSLDPESSSGPGSG